MLFSTHVNHVSVSPTKGIGPTQGQKKTLTRVGILTPVSFSLSLCGPNSISRANPHMVKTGRKQHFTLPQHRLRIDYIGQARISYGKAFVAKFNP